MQKMNIYPEFKKIAGHMTAVQRLSDKISEKIDTDGFEFSSAYLVSGCTERGGHLYQGGARLDNCGLVDNDYYCEQHTGYCEDDYHGTVYFKTNVPGQFVAIPFDM